MAGKYILAARYSSDRAKPVAGRPASPERIQSFPAAQRSILQRTRRRSAAAPQDLFAKPPARPRCGADKSGSRRPAARQTRAQKTPCKVLSERHADTHVAE